jgi:CoA:oxalate CoA-transferase
VLLALRRRDLTGRGQSVDVSLFDVAMSILAYAFGDVLLRGSRPRRDGSRTPYAFTTTYEASDGYVFVAPNSPQMWLSFSRIVGHPEWAEPGSPYLEQEARLRDRKELEAEIERWTRGRTRAEIAGTLTAHGIACGPVNQIDEAIMSPLVAARNMVEWITTGDDPERRIPVPGVEVKIGPDRIDRSMGSVPRLGADTDSVLMELGYEDVTIGELRRSGIVR